MTQETPQTQALAPREPRAEVRIGDAGVQIHSVEEGMRFAKYVVASGLAPKGDSAEAVFIKLQAGLELGFTPMRALAALVVVNGRLSLDGQSTLALIRASGLARVHVYNEGQGDERAGVFEFERLDTGERGKVAFTVADAKRAGLMGKDTYKGYPDDMTCWRAVARGAKRYFSDILFGLEVAEVARELPAASIETTVSETPRLQAPPADPDPLLASVTAGEHASHSEVEVPLGDPPPFESHAAADAQLVEDDGQGRLIPPPAARRHRG